VAARKDPGVKGAGPWDGSDSSQRDARRIRFCFPEKVSKEAAAVFST